MCVACFVIIILLAHKPDLKKAEAAEAADNAAKCKELKEAEARG